MGTDKHFPFKCFTKDDIFRKRMFPNKSGLFGLQVGIGSSIIEILFIEFNESSY